MEYDKKKKNNKKNQKNKTDEEFLVQSPSINPDDIEIDDEISPDERLRKKKKEDH
ncbi:hypothetical protein [Halothermothrix orenii]|uniref:hypothetical protein n=1 Tax=Halothermothrix orenii TaxID=31909 RepID=UPI00031C39A6|nr:hypothetical protein [Halothermothrix orenii]